MGSSGWDEYLYEKIHRELARAPFLLLSPSLLPSLSHSFALFLSFSSPAPFPTVWGNGEKTAIYKPGRELSPETVLSRWPWTSSLQNYEIINAFCFKQIIFLWQPCYYLPWWISDRESACQCRSPRLDPWVGKLPWRRKWQPTPVFLPGKSDGQRSLVGCSSWGHKRVGHHLASKQQS